MDAKSKLMAYLKGWAHGAGRKAIQFEDQLDYMRGYKEGHSAYHEAAAKAQEYYGATLSILRVQPANCTCLPGDPPCPHCGAED